MHIRISIGLIAVLLTSCNSRQQDSSAASTTENMVTVDTVVGSRIITDEIAGSAYRKRAIGYFVIIGKDSSGYTCIFTESKVGGEVGIDLNIPYLKTTMTYGQRLEELKIILSKAATDFNFDSLNSISFGRLILSGDLAVDITKQYYQKFGTNHKPENYQAVAQFLKESKLGTDLNSLFRPYSISVDKVFHEKLFFTTRKELYWASKIDTDTANVPEKIIDCITGVRLTRK